VEPKLRKQHGNTEPSLEIGRCRDYRSTGLSIQHPRGWRYSPRFSES